MTTRSKLAARVLCCLITSSCASDLDSPLEEERDQGLRFDVGVQTHGCNAEEDQTILDAMNEMLELKTTRRAEFAICVSAAPLVETMPGNSMEDCALQLDRAYPIWEVLDNQLLDATCADLSAKNAAGEGRVGIEGTRMKLDHDFLADYRGSPRIIAGTIVHELMHNRGYRHVRNKSGTDLYPLTVPEQVEACVETGTFNPAPAGFPDIPGDCQTRAADGDWFCSSATGANGSCAFYTKEFQQYYGYAL